jgi:NADH:ubiquinone oxidoreductase subunit 6 (subunit J)
MTVDIAFWLLAIASVASALAVVFVRDLFRAALFLVVCFFTVAGIYVTLNADFLAAVQVLVYIGAIATLLIFAIMLTRDARRGSPTGKLKVPALFVGIALLGVMIWSLVSYDWAPTSDMSGMVPVQGIAGLLFASEGGWVLTFEIAGLMLLASIVGAMVLLREK